MTLHIHNKAPETGSLQSCKNLLIPGSEILLIGDGVLALLQPETRELLADTPCYALKQDCEARGLLKKVPGGVTLIDMDGFVGLTEKHEVIQSW